MVQAFDSRIESIAITLERGPSRELRDGVRLYVRGLFPIFNQLTMKFTSQSLKRFLRLFAIWAGALFLFVVLLDQFVMPFYVQEGKTTRVPDVLGMKVQDAEVLLTQQGLVGKEAEVREDKQYPEGTVAAQNPPAGSVVKFGRGVYLTVSGGTPTVRMPALRGRSLRDANLTLERFGLRVGDIQYQVSQGYPENTIIEQGIPEGKEITSRSSVSLIVSQGPSANRVPVPNVVRKSLTEAERVLLNAGLTLGKVTYQVNLSMLPNTVLDQYPRGDGFAVKGQAIDLFVAQKAENITPLEN